MNKKLTIVESIKKNIGIQSELLTRNFTHLLRPENYHYPIFYPPYNDLYSAAITPNKLVKDQLENMQENERRVSFYFCIPWCRHRCPYCLYNCNIINNMDTKFKEKYVRALVKELDLYRKSLSTEVYSIYIGGGTPALIGEHLLKLLLQELQDRGVLFSIKELDFEFHPNDIYEDLVPTLEDFLGKRRLRFSVGVQSFIQKRINNIRGKNTYRLEKVKKVCQYFQDKEYNFNIDIMWGLRDEDVEEELNYIRQNEICPTTFTFYQIEAPGDVYRYRTYVENIERDIRSILKQRNKIFKAMRKLDYESALYPSYFKRKLCEENPIIYNIAQMEGDSYYIGLGIGGHTKLEKLAYVNTTEISKYIDMIQHNKFPLSYLRMLDREEKEKRNNLLRLRIPGEKFDDQFLQKLMRKNNNAYRELKKVFFLNSKNGKYKLSNKGKKFVDELIRIGTNVDVTLLARYDKRKINEYLSSSWRKKSSKKIRDVLLFIRNSVRQILLQEQGIKQFVANMGYVSERFREPIINDEPIDLIMQEGEWRKRQEEFLVSSGDKLYYFSELFKSMDDIGFTYPMIIDGEMFCGGDGAFDVLIDALKIGRNLDELKKKKKEQKKFLKMHELFDCYFRELSANGYSSEDLKFFFLISRFESASAGGAVVLMPSLDDIKAVNHLCNLSTYLEEIFGLISEKEFQSKISEYALRSAVTSIMARNMSHIHGSHIEPGLQHRMQSFEKEIIGVLNGSKTDVYSEMLEFLERKNAEGENRKLIDFRDLFKWEISPEWKLKALIELIKEEANRQLSYYRQRKEDLIARMATDWPSWGTGLDFFTFFVQPLFENPLLLHFINLSDDIGLSQTIIRYGYAEDSQIVWARFKLKIDEDVFNANLVDYAISLLKEIEFKDGENKKIVITPAVDNLKSSIVRVCDADIGVQAFLSLFEGIIRNSAKHRNVGGKQDNLEARIVFFEDGEKIKKLFNENVDAPSIPKDNKYSYVLLSVNLDVLEERTVREGDKEKPLLDFLKEKFADPIIDATGQITPLNWGLKEIKICAAYVSGSSLEKVNTSKPNYLWVLKSPKQVWEEDGAERLAYLIRLEKPRHVLAVVPEESKRSLNIADWEKYGIKIVTPSELTGVNSDYDFLYLDKSVSLPKEIDIQRQVKGNLVLDNYKSNPMDFFYEVYDLYIENECVPERYNWNRGKKGKKIRLCVYWDDCNKKKQWQRCWQKLQTSKKTPGYINNFSFDVVNKECNEDCNFRTIQLLRHRGISRYSDLHRSKARVPYYREFASYSSPFFSFLFNIEPSSLGNLVIRQFIESAIVNVLVIDERIAQALTTLEAQDSDGKVKLEEKLYWTGVYVAKSVNVDSKPFRFVDTKEKTRMRDVDLNEILNSLGSFYIDKCNDGDNNIPIHILLIHATKLNDFAKELKKTNEDLVSDLKKSIPYIIIHSGRGKTEGDIPSNAPFLEYSILQRYLLQEPSKFYLAQIALSTMGGV